MQHDNDIHCYAVELQELLVKNKYDLIRCLDLSVFEAEDVLRRASKECSPNATTVCSAISLFVCNYPPRSEGI